MATAQLEAAIAALPAKKRRLRQSFDRLVACAPSPIPFTWDDLDAHISSLESSIAARFRQLQSLQDTHAAAPTTTDPVEHLGNEDQEPRVEHHVRDKGHESNEDGERAERAPSDLKAVVNDVRVEEATEASPPEREDDEEGEVIKAAADQDNDVEGEAIEASHGHALEEENENTKEAMMASAYRSNGETKGEVSGPIPDIAGGAEAAARPDPVAACANMDASTFADMLCWRNKRCLRARRQFLPALLGAAEPHALVVRAIRDFLVRAEPKSDKHWENCGALLHCVRNLTAAPSVDTLEQANRLAEDWKEMIGKPESCRDLGRLAIWGLLSFLIPYNIILDFDAHETIYHFGKMKSCIELCNCLGLIHTLTDSINRLIENGQQLDAVRLACVLNLTDKYPPLSILNEYVDKAKKTAQEILSKESDSPESLNQAMTKQVNTLILSWSAIDECNIDSVHRNSIRAEITLLLHKYAHKRQCLWDSSLSTLSPHQQHNLQQQLQMPEEQHHQHHQHQKLQEKQHRKAQGLQPIPDEQHHYQQKAQEEPEQDWSQQKLWEKRQNRKRKRNQRREQQRRAQEMRQHRFRKQPRLSHASSFAHSPYNAGPGIRNHSTQQFSGIRGVPPWSGSA